MQKLNNSIGNYDEDDDDDDNVLSMKPEKFDMESLNLS